MAINIGPQLMADLNRRYKAGELTKNEYQYQRARLEEKIARGEAIKRTPAELALKWGLIVVLIGLGLAMIIFFDDWFFRIVGGAQIISAIFMARRP